jgi:uncharacterized protein YndB with AHSA1/START domain
MGNTARAAVTALRRERLVEWTGVRYNDLPTVEVSIEIAASPQHVWKFISDPTLIPEFSQELQAVEWLDGLTEARLGGRFVGHSKHASLGVWSTTSYIVEYEPLRVFAWAVDSVDNPSASWRFTLEPDSGGTVLRQWAQLGPGPSGLSAAIERMPDKEQKIVFVRLREFEAGMLSTLSAIKGRAEAAACAETDAAT